MFAVYSDLLVVSVSGKKENQASDCFGLMAQEISVRVPQPRQLGENETIESLKHWRMAFRNYYRRDSYFKTFLDSSLTWDPNP